MGSVLVDVATFQVSYATGYDMEAATLRTAREKSETPDGAMERYTWVRFAEKLTFCHTIHIATVSTPMEELSGKVQKASAGDG